MKLKYPRTPHLPNSTKDPDDLQLKDYSNFQDKDVVVTLKLDGANTTLYHDYVHGRSLDYKPHPSRNHIKELQARIGYQLDKDLRICGENMWAKHTIGYEDLESYFYVISIWKGLTCLDWGDTVELLVLLDLPTVPVIYEGKFNLEGINKSFEPFKDNHEGYVVRVAGQFSYEDFGKSVAKYRIPTFDNSESVFDKIIQNKLK